MLVRSTSARLRAPPLSEGSRRLKTMGAWLSPVLAPGMRRLLSLFSPIGGWHGGRVTSAKTGAPSTLRLLAFPQATLATATQVQRQLPSGNWVPCVFRSNPLPIPLTGRPSGMLPHWSAGTLSNPPPWAMNTALRQRLRVGAILTRGRHNGQTAAYGPSTVRWPMIPRCRLR